MRILLTTLNSKYVHSNLALKYMYGVARRHLSETEVTLQEFTINNPMEYIYGEIVRGDYDLICFSCYIWNIEKMKELGARIRQASPNVRILAGGPEVSFDTSEIMSENPWIDCVIRGEGEKAFDWLCEQISAEGCLECVDGIIDGAGIGCENNNYPMDIIPFPYENLGLDSDKVIYYETVRGCPYRCAYCLSSIDKSIRMLSVERVKKELGFFIDSEVKQVKFIDRTFNYDRERAYEVWEYLINNDNGITNFHFEVCGELFDEKQLRLLEKARKGLFQFEIGIQSTCSKALAGVDRKPATDRLFENVRKIIALGNIHTHVDLIAGLPYEDYITFGKSFNDVYSLGADNLQLGFLKLLRGTKIRSFADTGEYRFGDRAPYEIISNRWISAKELIRLKMIENVLDLYSNKGGFSRSLKALMLQENTTAFEFYENLSEFFYREGFQHRSHKKEDLYRILMKFTEERWSDEAISEKIRKSLGQDLEAAMNFDAVKKFYKKGWKI